jgi:hypothetical protein
MAKKMSARERQKLKTYLASIAMQAIISKSPHSSADSRPYAYEGAAKGAVLYANALMKELEK